MRLSRSLSWLLVSVLAFSLPCLSQERSVTEEQEQRISVQFQMTPANESIVTTQGWVPKELPVPRNSSDPLSTAISQLADAVSNLAVLMSKTKSDFETFRLTFDQRLKQIEESLTKTNMPRSPQ